MGQRYTQSDPIGKMISNFKPLSNINQLLQLGLGRDKQKLAWYRAILQDPKNGIYNMNYRDLSVEVFDKLINYMLNDPVIYNRTRQLLSQSNPTTTKAFEALVKKAEKSGIELTEVLEAYNIGYDQEYPLHLSPEQKAFNKVNEFINKRRMSESNESKTLNILRKIAKEKR